MAQPWLAWLVWDLLTAVLVLLVLLAPVIALGAGVYFVKQWRKGNGSADGSREYERGTPA
jgi:heme/copper-type cytochrome/quinol oxidase subunit 2